MTATAPATRIRELSTIPPPSAHATPTRARGEREREKERKSLTTGGFSYSVTLAIFTPYLRIGLSLIREAFIYLTLSRFRVASTHTLCRALPRVALCHTLWSPHGRAILLSVCCAPRAAVPRALPELVARLLTLQHHLLSYTRVGVCFTVVPYGVVVLHSRSETVTRAGPRRYAVTRVRYEPRCRTPSSWVLPNGSKGTHRQSVTSPVSS